MEDEVAERRKLSRLKSESVAFFLLGTLTAFISFIFLLLNDGPKFFNGGIVTVFFYGIALRVWLNARKPKRRGRKKVKEE
jgi:hypothetical protein